MTAHQLFSCQKMKGLIIFPSCLVTELLYLIRVIESSRYHSRSIDDKFTMMLAKWLEVSTEHTWSDLSAALEAIGNKRLACSIKEKYGEGEGKTKFNFGNRNFY